MTRTGRTERGAVIPLTGLLLVVIMTSVAFAVDLGRLASERRSMQADADVIALDLVRLADGRTEDAILLSAGYNEVLNRSAAANEIAVTDLVVDYGVYDVLADTFTPTAGTQVPNAVQVRASSEIEYFFAQVFTSDEGRTHREAIAGLDGYASLTLGSRTASFESGDSAAIDLLLKSLLGDDADLDVVAAGYGGAADFDVDLGDLADVDGGAASPDEVLTADTTAQGYGLLLADALRNDGRTVEADIIESLALQADSTTTFKVEELVDAESGGPPAVADADVNAFDQVVAALQLVNSQNAVAECAAVPGYAVGSLVNTSLDVCSSVIEAGKTVVGRVGSPATRPPLFRTAQVRVATTSGTDVLTNVLGLARVAGRLAVPVELTGGGAQGRLDQVLCDRAGGQSTTTTFVSPRPIAAALGGTAPIATLGVYARVGFVEIKVAEIEVRLNKVVDPTDGAGASIPDQVIDTTEEGPGSALALNLGPIGPSDLNATVRSGALPTGVGLSAITAALAPTVNALLAGLEGPQVEALLDGLGLGVSESDLRLNDVVCNSPLLRG